MSLPVLIECPLVLQLSYHCVGEKLKDGPRLPGLLA